MKSFVIFSSLLVVSSVALGYGVNFESKLQSIQKKIDNRKMDHENMSQQINKLKTQLEVCKEKYNGDQSCGGFLSGGLKNTENTMARMEKARKEIEADMNELNKEAQKVEADRQKLKDAIASEKEKKTQAEHQRVRQAFTEDGLKQMEAKFEISTLGREMDKMEIGKYVAAKVGLALNSRAFCQSMRRCGEPEGSANNKVTPEQMREIFPGMSDIFSQQKVDFWQSANENRGQGKATPKASQ